MSALVPAGLVPVTGLLTEKAEEGVSYWRLDPTGRKPPKQITKRQWERDSHFIAFFPTAPKVRS